MDMFWKKESNQDGALYVDLSKDFDECPPEVPYVSNKHKNKKVTAELLDAGDKEFSQSNYLDALNYYDESLCFCEIGSENMSVAYENRANCFFEFKLYSKCVADIELALTAKCPSQNVPKLLELKGYCFRLMETDHPIEEFRPQLSFEEDERFLGMANAIEITCNEEFGRHIKAKCDIDVGNIVLLEKLFISTSNDTEWKFCNHCLKRVTNLIPCSRCTYAMYCDSACLESDIFHEIECGVIDGVNKVSRMLQHIQRSLIVAINIFPTIEDLMEFVEEAVRDKSKKVPSSILDNKSRYYSYLQLHVHCTLQRSNNILKTTHLTYPYFLSIPLLKEKFNTEKKQRFLKHLIGYHFSIFMSNGFFDGNNTHSCIILSYFSHSCSPNVKSYNHENMSICVATRPIKKGEQLFISYCIMDNPNRRERIYESWGVQCNCEKCEPCSQAISDDEKLFPSITTDLDIILNGMKDESYKTNKTKLLMMKEMHIRFLRKYGRLHWNDKIELVTNYFIQALQYESAFIYDY